jgi:hypothetical protein
VTNSQGTLTVTTVTRPKRVAFFVHEENLTNDEINGIISFNCRHWGGRFNPIIPTSGSELNSDWWRLLTAADPDIIYSFVKITDALGDRINRHVLPSRIFEINPADILKRGGIVGVDEHRVAAITTYEIPRLIWGRRGGWREPAFQFVQDSRTATDARTFALRNFGVLPADLSTRTMFRDMPHRTIETKSAAMDAYLDLEALQAQQWPVFPMDLCAAFACRSYTPAYETRVPGFHLVIGDTPWEALYTWNLAFQQRPDAGREALWLPSSAAENGDLLTRVGKWIGKVFWGDQYDRRGSVVSYSESETLLDKIAKHISPLAHIHFAAFRPAPKSHPFPSSLDKIHRIPNRFASDEIPLTVTDQVPVSGNELLARVVKPTFYSANEEQFGWMVEVGVNFRPETYFYTNIRPNWRLPKRLGVPQLFVPQGGIPARVDWSGGPCFEVPGANDTLRIHIPNDRSVISVSCFGTYHTNRVEQREAPRQERQFVDFYTSDKGRHVRGMVQSFGSIYHAGQYFEDPYWRSIFYTLASRAEPEEFEKKRVDLVKDVLQTWFQDRKDFCGSEAQLAELAGNVAERLTFRDGPAVALTFNELVGRHANMHGKAMRRGGNSNYWQAHKKFDALRESDLTRLVAQNILIQGISIRCPHCYTTHWHAVDNLSSTVKCDGCLSSFQFPLNKKWSFRLNDLVVNAIRYHGTVSVLHALYFMQNYGNLHGMFMYLPCQDLHVRDEKGADGDPAKIEMKDGELHIREGLRHTDLDILVVTEGRISIGEVKSDPQGFAKEDFTRLKTIAAELRPDELVLAAVGTAWPARVNEQIDLLSQDLAKVDIVVTPLLLEWFRTDA